MMSLWSSVSTCSLRSGPCDFVGRTLVLFSRQRPRRGCVSARGFGCGGARLRFVSLFPKLQDRSN
jgi:hypothetical protein